MRYYINFDRTVNQFVPHYIGGRKLILFLQAILKPLQKLNDDFSEWAKETKIEAMMTSQIFQLEWFLNRKLKKYFKDQYQLISIKNSVRTGTLVYWQENDSTGKAELLLKHQSESNSKTATFKYHEELVSCNTCSFFVYTPPINSELVSTDEYLAILSFYVDKYKISGKTFEIIFNK